MASLVLGGVVFRNFEIPQSIIFPIRQRHHIHLHVGSDRVVDATGPDPQPIRWSGRFTGPDASSRVRTLQVMTAAGAELPLVYASFQERVLIIDFTPDLTKSYDIYYQIEVLPTTNQGGGSGGLAQLSESMGTVTGLDIAAAITGAANAAAIAAEAP